jgi:hypothetical protein
VLGGTMHEMVWKGEEGESDDEYSRSTGRSLAGDDDDDSDDSDSDDSDSDSGEEVGDGCCTVYSAVSRRQLELLPRSQGLCEKQSVHVRLATMWVQRCLKQELTVTALFAE